MKIKIMLEKPVQVNVPGFPCWNCLTIDDFVAQFVDGEKLSIADYSTEIQNFEQHSDTVATFDTKEQLDALDTFDVVAEILKAVSSFGLNNVYATVDYKYPDEIYRKIRRTT